MLTTSKDMKTQYLVDGKQVDEANHEPNIVFLWRHNRVEGLMSHHFAEDYLPKEPFAFVRMVGLTALGTKQRYVREWRLTDARGWLVLVATGNWDDTPEAKLKELFSNLAIARYGLHNDDDEGVI